MEKQLEESWIMIDEKLIYFYIKRKKIKNMYMRFTSDGKLLITTSKSCKLENIEKFIKAKKQWIFKQINFQEKINKYRENKNFSNEDNLYYLGKKYKARIIPKKRNEIYVDDRDIVIAVKEKFITNNEYVKRVYEDWLKEECLKITTTYILEYLKKMQLYKIPFPETEIKKFKSRWGCCIQKKCKVEFAMNLVKVPKECIEYVVVHELTHFKYIHHDKSFYDFVSLFIPDWKERRDCLNKEFGRIIV